MFLLDSNVWIAQTFDAHPGHTSASQSLLMATAERPAIFCRATEQSFLRLASTPAVLRQYGAQGLTNQDALVLLAHFQALPMVAFRAEPPGIVPLWHRLAGLPQAAPKVWMDAYLAAFAIAGNLTMITLDSDLKQYEPAGLQLQLLSSA